MCSAAKNRFLIPVIQQVNKIHRIVYKNQIVYIKIVQKLSKRKTTKKVSFTIEVVHLQALYHQVMNV